VTVLRSQLIEVLGELGDETTIAEARRRYTLSASDSGAYPAGLRKAILGVVAGNADAATWDALRAQARAATNPLLKDRLYRYLASARDEALTRRALDLALTDEPGATNGAEMVAAVAEEHPDLAFDFALAHRERMDTLVDASARSRYYPRLASGSLDPAMADKVKRYGDAYLRPESRRAAETAAAKVGYRVTVARERLEAVDAWLKEHSS
jgi:hypothetical protein